MKRIDRYLLSESLPPLVFGLLLYSVLAVVSTTIPRLQWVVGVPFAPLASWLALQLPNAIVQTLPIALVLAVLLGFGRLAADRELLAMQAGALSLPRVGLTYLVLAMLCTGTALALNQWVLPTTNARVGSVWWELTSGGSGLFRLAGQGIPIDDYTVTFLSTDRRTDELRDVRIEKWDGRRLSVLFADTATFEERGLRLHGYRTTVIDLGALDRTNADPERVLRELVRADNRPANPESTLLLTTSSAPEELITRHSGGGFDAPDSITTAYQHATDPERSAVDRRHAAVTFHRKLAEPFASFTLLLMALPLAIHYARSRSVAFGLSLVVTLVWYLLLTFGQLLAQTGAVPVWAGLWAPNIVLALAGAVMLVGRPFAR